MRARRYCELKRPSHRTRLNSSSCITPVEKLRVLRLHKMNGICLKTSKLNYNRDHSESIRLDLKEPKPETTSVLGTHPEDR